jgi:citrate lyase subunit beta / citryl-CoA lyase
VDALLAQLAAARSFLVFPGDDDRKRARALVSGADAVVLDLEDGVAAAAKDEGRSRVAPFAAEPGTPARLVRVNDPSGPTGQLDLAAVESLDGVALVVPKAGLASVALAAEVGRPIVALVEDAAGIRDAYELAEHPAVIALAIGSADLNAALGLVADGSGAELAFTRSQLVVASAAARIRPPVDGPCLDVRDAAALEREARQARALGLRGKLCIHPGQVDGVHRALAPGRDEVEWARRVAAGWEELQERGDAVGVVDGSLVDLPVVVRARAIIEASEGSEAG